MNTTIDYPHLAVTSDGRMRIGDSRYTVLQLASEHDAHGWTAGEPLRQHPDLHPEGVYTALTFSYDKRETMISEMKPSLTAAEQIRPSRSFTRTELLPRKTGQENQSGASAPQGCSVRSI